MNDYTLFGDRVLVLPDPVETETKSGILLTSKQMQENVLEGTITLIGPEVTDLKVGDKVKYGSFSGITLKLSEGDFILVHIADILLKVGK